MKLLLTRHGKTEENIAGITLGQNPGILSEEGIQQVKELREKLKKFKIHVVYSSDLKRCVDTAKILTANSNLETKLDPRLREINFGDYQDKPYSEIKEDYLSSLDRPFPNGESNNQMIRRVIDAVNDMIKHHPNETVLAVCHSGPISVVTAATKKINFAEALNVKPDHDDILELNLEKPLEYPR